MSTSTTLEVPVAYFDVYDLKSFPEEVLTAASHLPLHHRLMAAGAAKMLEKQFGPFSADGMYVLTVELPSLWIFKKIKYSIRKF